MSARPGEEAADGQPAEAAPAGEPGSPLRLLVRQPMRFRFDAAVHLLTRAAQAGPAEAIRFRSPPGLAQPQADILAVQPDAAARPVAVTTTVMGLAGPSGVLPRLYTEVLVGTLRGGSRALHDFLDMLQHRLVAMFADAGAKYRPHLAHDRRLRPSRDGADDVAQVLLALTGHGTPGLLPRLAAGPEALLHYAGFFAMRPRSAERLTALVSDWLGRPVRVEQFAGAWLPIPPDQRSTLGRGRAPGAFSALGVDATAGVRAWDAQARIVLRIGPLDRAAFDALLPDGQALPRLVALVRAFLGLETGFAVNLVLRGDDIPPLRLDAAARPAPRLGWNCWLPRPSPGPGGQPRPDASDALFEAEMTEALARRGETP